MPALANRSVIEETLDSSGAGKPNSLAAGLGSAKFRSIASLDGLDQVLIDVIFVKPGPVQVIRVKAVVSLRVNHEDLRDLLFQDELIYGLVEAAVSVRDPARVIVI